MSQVLERNSDLNIVCPVPRVILLWTHKHSQTRVLELLKLFAAYMLNIIFIYTKVRCTAFMKLFGEFNVLIYD